MRFAINHITAPKLSLEDFFATARNLGLSEVEIRNDLPDIVGTVDPAAVKAAAEKAGVTIISINALYPFNVWSGDLPKRAVVMADYAAASGAKALVMCPLNEGRQVPFDDLVAALKAMKPILEERGLTGLVEPLGGLAHVFERVVHREHDPVDAQLRHSVEHGGRAEMARRGDVEIGAEIVRDRFARGVFVRGFHP